MESGEIVLSSKQPELRELIIKLLGRGLTTSFKIAGEFHLSLEDIEDIVARIGQRVKGQNNCQMSDFHARFIFQDGAEDLIPDEIAFQQFRSLNKTLCSRVEINFAYLIAFSDRAPEKQAVNLEFEAHDYSSDKESETESESYGKISIEYTDVTWANDLKNIFAEFMKEHISQTSIFVKLASSIERSKWLMPVSMIIALLISMLVVARRDEDFVIKKFPDLFSNSDTSINLIDKKIDILLMRLHIDQPEYFLFLIASIVLGFSLVILTINFQLRKIKYSSIFISSASKMSLDKLKKRKKNSILFILGSFLFAVIASLTASKLLEFLDGVGF